MAHGCKQAGGFVDTGCCAMCDCHETMKLPPEIALAYAERDAADEVSRTAQTYVRAMEGRLRAAREFVIRHPVLTLIDLAEFDAFLKMDDALASVGARLPSPETNR